jgi:hypothetical protein
MSQLPLTPTLSPKAGRGSVACGSLPPRERGEGGARVSGRVRDLLWRGGVNGATLCAIILSLALGGCAKKNAPQPPPDVPNTYPRPYPSE